MIQFFRHIRKTLVVKNQAESSTSPVSGSNRFWYLLTSKYLKYAIGEIILVMVGILLALQVNNWNEVRHQKRSIDQSLLEVQSNLINDSISIYSSLEQMRKEMTSQKEIIAHLSKDLILDSTFNENLGKCLVIADINITQNGYNRLTRFGLENLQNKGLENMLIRYYDIQYKYYLSEVNDDSKDLMDVWLPYVRKNFVDYDYRNYAIPIDYNQLSKDSEFLIMLKININNREATVSQLTRMQQTARGLLEAINAYLDT